MTVAKRPALLAWLIVLLVVVIDQAVKFWIKTHFYLGENHEVFSWFHIVFVQNNGMAFGLELFDKYLLTFMRIVLFGFLVWYMWRLCKIGRTPAGYLVSIALVAAGAMGNIIDCVIYGEIFTNPMPPQVAQLVPWGSGYGGLFNGLVVDMLYFPLFSFTWPDWIPFVGGDEFSFFDPVFNIADASISVGVLAVLIFYFNYMERSLHDEDPAADDNRS